MSAILPPKVEKQVRDRARMMASLLVLVTVVLFAGCENRWGPPYAFRLMVPPSAEPLVKYVVPYYWWTELGVYDSFVKCVDKRNEIRQIKEDSVGMLFFCPNCSEKSQRTLAGRLRLAKCIPLR